MKKLVSLLGIVGLIFSLNGAQQRKVVPRLGVLNYQAQRRIKEADKVIERAHKKAQRSQIAHGYGKK